MQQPRAEGFDMHTLFLCVGVLPLDIWPARTHTQAPRREFAAINAWQPSRHVVVSLMSLARAAALGVRCAAAPTLRARCVYFAVSVAHNLVARRTWLAAIAIGHRPEKLPSTTAVGHPPLCLFLLPTWHSPMGCRAGA